MIKALFFVMSCFLLGMGLWLYPKTKEKLELITWIVLSFFATTLIDTFIAGIFSAIGVSVNIVSLGVSNLLIGIFLLTYIKVKKSEVQKYGVDLRNLFILFAICGIVWYIAYMRFGIDLYYFRYSNGDSARHLEAAMNTYNLAAVENMYFTHLGDSIFMECSYFLKKYELYKAFIAYDIYLLCMQGFLFWLLIVDLLKNKFTYIMGLALTVVYLLGYPLNNFIHGTEYWGAGVLVITFIVLLLKLYSTKLYSLKFLLFLLLLANSALSVSYILFVPAVYAGELIYLSIDYIKNGKKLKTYIIDMLLLFSFGTVMFAYYGLGGMLGGISNSVQTTQHVISLGGWVYKDLYVIYIPFCMFSVSYFKRVFEKKMNDEVCWIFLTNLIQLILCFWLIMSGKMQSYYFFKQYFPVMFIMMYVMIKEIVARWESNKDFICSYMIVYTIVFLVAVLGGEDKINERNPEMANPVKGTTLFELYTSNITMTKQKWSNVNDTDQDLYMFVGELRSRVDCDIPLFLNITDNWNDIGYLYYYNMTNQAQSNWSSYRIAEENVVGKDEIAGLDYATILRDSIFYNNNAEWLQTKEIVYDNGLYVVYKLN